MCLEKGYYIDIFQINQLIQERKRYWDAIYYRNPKMMFYVNIIDRMTGEEFEK
jgi:hypothetical protein